jgi:hypothetical protein
MPVAGDVARPRKRNQRRQPTFEERLTPCRCCNYPLTQRHHLDGFIDGKEFGDTIQLCANCHDLFHIIRGARRDLSICVRTSRNVTLYLGLIVAWNLVPNFPVVFRLVNQADRWDRVRVRMGSAFLESLVSGTDFDATPFLPPEALQA